MFLEEDLIEHYPGYWRYSHALRTIASFSGLEVWQVADSFSERIVRYWRIRREIAVLKMARRFNGAAGTDLAQHADPRAFTGQLDPHQQRHLELVLCARSRT